MGVKTNLDVEDGHRLDAYLAEPEGKPKAGLVVIQEIFAVNGHIRSVCDRFAAEGYAALAPSLFDRVERGVELDYSETNIEKGRLLRTRLGWDEPLRDIRAAVDRLEGLKGVGVVGYCWGGSLAFLSACRLEIGCAVGYYGAQIAQYADQRPRCPVMLHFGKMDPLIPPEDVAAIQKARPEATIHEYPAGHGFNCDLREDHHPPSAAQALERTLAFFAAHLG